MKMLIPFAKLSFGDWKNMAFAVKIGILNTEFESPGCKNAGKHHASVERIGILFWNVSNFVDQIAVQNIFLFQNIVYFYENVILFGKMLVWYTKSTVFVSILDIVHTQETFAVYNFGVQK